MKTLTKRQAYLILRALRKSENNDYTTLANANSLDELRAFNPELAGALDVLLHIAYIVE